MLSMLIYLSMRTTYSGALFYAYEFQFSMRKIGLLKSTLFKFCCIKLVFKEFKILPGIDLFLFSQVQ